MPKNPWKDPFHVIRNTAFLRARAQANFRNEDWQLTFQDWCEYWNTPEKFARRGRAVDSLCLMRYDDEDSWTRANCCIIPRSNMIKIRNRRTVGKPVDHLWEEAEWLE